MLERKEQNQPEWTPQALGQLQELLTQFQEAGITTVWDTGSAPVERSTQSVINEVKQVLKSEEDQHNSSS